MALGGSRQLPARKETALGRGGEKEEEGREGGGPVRLARPEREKLLCVFI